MSTTKKSPERCALGCTDIADIIPREPCIGFWGRWFSCYCRRVLQLRSSSPVRRHLVETTHHLIKALPFKEKNQQCKLAQHKRQYHTVDTTGWNDLRCQGPGSSAWPYSAPTGIVLLRGAAEDTGSMKGLP